MDDINVLVDSGAITSFDKELLDRIVFAGEPYVCVASTATIYDILVLCGVFKSKNEARKNWTRGQIKVGMNDFGRIGKLKRHLFVFKFPTTMPDLETSE